MINLVDRIQAALDYSGTSWSGASVKVGLSPQAASKWKKGQIGRETLKKLAEVTGVNSGWLLDGQGDMHPAQQNSQAQSTYGQQDQLSRPLNELIETLKTLDSKNELNPALIETLKSMVGVATSSKKDK